MDCNLVCCPICIIKNHPINKDCHTNENARVSKVWFVLDFILLIALLYVFTTESLTTVLCFSASVFLHINNISPVSLDTLLCL